MKIIAFALLLAAACVAQTSETKSPERSFYKLDFVLKEFESGKQVSARAYSSMVGKNGKAAIRTGDKVTVPMGTAGQTLTVDVGVYIDATVLGETSGKLELKVVATFEGHPSDSSRNSYRWESDALVPLRKATTIFSSDAISTKRQTQLEVTATPVQ
jgi:hypothetical protein